LDITLASDYVTVSWCKFNYTFDSGHNFVNLLGSDDADIADAGRLHVTFHHNWWSTLSHERMPRVRYGRVHSYNNYFNAPGNNYCVRAALESHSYNNYFNAPGNNYCVRAALESQVFLEKNWFENVKTPWEKFITTGATGLVSAVSNVFVNVTGQSDPGTDTVFTVPYRYTLDDTAGLPLIITNNAGAARIGPPLNISWSGSSTVLSWTTNVPGFRLQHSADLVAANWFDDATLVQVVGDQNTVTEPPSQTVRFFRLFKP
jgi:pectate lyase